MYMARCIFVLLFIVIYCHLAYTCVIFIFIFYSFFSVFPVYSLYLIYVFLTLLPFFFNALSCSMFVPSGIYYIVCLLLCVFFILV